MSKNRTRKNADLRRVSANNGSLPFHPNERTFVERLADSLSRFFQRVTKPTPEYVRARIFRDELLKSQFTGIFSDEWCGEHKPKGGTQ